MRNFSKGVVEKNWTLGSKKKTSPSSLAAVKINNRETNAQDYYVTTTVAKPFYLVLERCEKYLLCLLQQMLSKVDQTLHRLTTKRDVQPQKTSPPELGQ